MAIEQERRIRKRLDNGFVGLDWVAPLPEPPTARIIWVLPPSEFVRIELDRPKGQPYGPSAGMPGQTELFTAPDRSLLEIWLSLDAEREPSGQLHLAHLHTAIAQGARPGRIVLHSFGGLTTCGVVLHSEYVTASFLQPGPWDGPLERFQVVSFARGVYVGFERERWVLAFVTVLRER